jgi:hypothetical protein
MLGGTSSELNPNSAWLNSRGMWLSYCFGVLLIHFALLSFPFLTIAWTWTLTNLIHNTVFICCYFTCACTSLYTYSMKFYSQYNVLIDRSFWTFTCFSTAAVVRFHTSCSSAAFCSAMFQLSIGSCWYVAWTVCFRYIMSIRVLLVAIFRHHSLCLPFISASISSNRLRPLALYLAFSPSLRFSLTLVSNDIRPW